MTLEERVATYARVFDEAGGPEALGDAEKSYLEDALTGSSTHSVGLELEEIAWSFESLGLAMFNAEASEADVAGIFDRAFHARRTLWSTADRVLAVLTTDV